MAHIYISAAHKSSGKTIVSLGLCAAIKSTGLSVQPFKKGPDYIDPLWLSYACKQPCYNLDFFQMSTAEIESLFSIHHTTSDISFIEGNKGLHDGLSVDGSDSNAALAKLIGAPVILVLDTQGITRGIAPLVQGYQSFDAGIRIAGVILNKVGGPRHEHKLRQALEYYTDIPVIGAVHKHKDLLIEERHLGLIPSNETTEAQQQINKIAAIIQDQIDIKQVLDIAQTAKTITTMTTDHSPSAITTDSIKLGIVRDQAFGFYYADDLDALRQYGIELVFIDALNDKQLPDIDGLIIGGGFPESFAELLQNNTALKAKIKSVIESGLPVYAECGGLMYLAETITVADKTYDMVGALPIHTTMQNKPIGRGYVELEVSDQHPWTTQDSADQPTVFKAHEFHYSDVVSESSNLDYAYHVKRGYGIDGKYDGIIYKNVLASFSHLRNSNTRWVERFVQFVKQYQNSKMAKTSVN